MAPGTSTLTDENLSGAKTQNGSGGPVVLMTQAAQEVLPLDVMRRLCQDGGLCFGCLKSIVR